MREFGYRGPSEWDIGVHTWETVPELPLALIGRLRQLDDAANPGRRLTAQGELHHPQQVFMALEPELLL